MPSTHSIDCDCSACLEEERLGYDADFSDPKQYCRHGTWIGSWFGPDYICGYCEMGINVCDQCGKFGTGEGSPGWSLYDGSRRDRKQARKHYWRDVRYYSDQHKTLCIDCRARQARRISIGIRVLNLREREVRGGSYVGINEARSY